jgi:glycosyltransferase involved in cell wall biosynthesis
MKFSLVIPCYNESKNLPLLLEQCKEITSSVVEVILVDNGSSDDTSQILSSLLSKYTGIRSIKLEKNQGYGFGILAGLRASNGDILGWTHADMQTDPKDILNGLTLFDKYGDEIFVKGCRYGRPFLDIVFTVGMSIFETILLKKLFWDINAQPTMFSRIFFERWNSPPDDFSLDLYAYFQAQRMSLIVYRFPVMFKKRAYGVSSWNISWTGKWKFILRTIKYSLKLKEKFK